MSRDRQAAILLPGMMCDERMFAAQAKGLSASHDVTVARFDTGSSIEAFAQSALSAVPGNQTLDLVGLSMGGIVAMECMRQAPERIGRVVLMDTNALAEARDRQQLRGPQIQRALAGELDRVLIDEMKPLYLAPANRDNETLLALVLDMARQLGADVFERQSRALAGRRDYLATLFAWPGPACVVYGEHDTLCPADRHAQIHNALSNSQLHVVAGAGHLTTLEAPQTVTQILIDFLAT